MTTYVLIICTAAVVMLYTISNALDHICLELRRIADAEDEKRDDAQDT